MFQELFDQFVEIAKKSYDLIEKMCYFNKENQNECFLYFSIFKDHIGFEVGAEKVKFSRFIIS